MICCTCPVHVEYKYTVYKRLDTGVTQKSISQLLAKLVEKTNEGSQATYLAGITIKGTSPCMRNLTVCSHPGLPQLSKVNRLKYLSPVKLSMRAHFDRNTLHFDQSLECSQHHLQFTEAVRLMQNHTDLVMAEVRSMKIFHNLRRKKSIGPALDPMDALRCFEHSVSCLNCNPAFLFIISIKTLARHYTAQLSSSSSTPKFFAPPSFQVLNERSSNI